ncbi:hypothetical protein B0H12DRAFT_1082365 [Mycena haematopus]|nr:hypothetical protein B0H12DRAFT_1082365 [Mycena haematopus]
MAKGKQDMRRRDLEPSAVLFGYYRVEPSQAAATLGPEANNFATLRNHRKRAGDAFSIRRPFSQVVMKEKIALELTSIAAYCAPKNSPSSGETGFSVKKASAFSSMTTKSTHSPSLRASVQLAPARLDTTFITRADGWERKSGAGATPGRNASNATVATPVTRRCSSSLAASQDLGRRGMFGESCCQYHHLPGCSLSTACPTPQCILRSRLLRHTPTGRPSPLPTRSLRPTAQTIPCAPASSCTSIKGHSGEGGDTTNTGGAGLSDAIETPSREIIYFWRPSMEGKPQIADPTPPTTARSTPQCICLRPCLPHPTPPPTRSTHPTAQAIPRVPESSCAQATSRATRQGRRHGQHRWRGLVRCHRDLESRKHLLSADSLPHTYLDVRDWYSAQLRVDLECISARSDTEALTSFSPQHIHFCPLATKLLRKTIAIREVNTHFRMLIINEWQDDYSALKKLYAKYMKSRTPFQRKRKEDSTPRASGDYRKLEGSLPVRPGKSTRGLGGARDSALQSPI